MPSTHPPPSLHREAAQELKRTLVRAGYEKRAIAAAMGTKIGHSYRDRDIPIYLRRLATRTPLHTLIKLFRLGVRVGTTEAEEVFGQTELQALHDGAVIAIRDDEIEPLIEIKPVRGFAFANDFPARVGPGAEYVMGVSPSSMTLAALTVRRHVTSALDLGTGSGVQAIFASEHADRVVATDANPRALAFASFNARMNGISNIEFREGTYFAPVDGDRFGLIVSNPPYVISPESTWLYRDAGLEGDAVSWNVVRGAAEHLSDDGYASVLVNWGHRAGAGDDDARAHVAELACSAWILRSETHDALTYIGEWNSSLEGEAHGAAIDAWSAYYEKLGIEEISVGAVVLHKNRPPHTARLDEASVDGVDSCSDHIERAFRTARFLYDAPDEKILDAHLRLVDDHAVQQRLVCRDGAWREQEVRLRLRTGLHFEGNLDPGGLPLLRLLDGTRSVRDALTVLAEELGVRREDLPAPTLMLIRVLMALGFLDLPG